MGKKRAKTYEVPDPDIQKSEPTVKELEKQRKAFAAAARKLTEGQIQQRRERTPRNLTMESGRHRSAHRHLAKRAIQDSRHES